MVPGASTKGPAGIDLSVSSLSVVLSFISSAAMAAKAVLSVVDLVIEIVGCLEDKEDWLQASLTSKTFYAACAIELYRSINVDDLNADLLHWTLSQGSALGRLIKGIKIDRNLSMAFPRDPITAARPVKLLTPYLTNLRVFSIEMSDVDDLPATGLFHSLCHLSSPISSLTILGPAASMTLKDLYPVLKRFESSLQHLKLSGLAIEDEVFLPSPLKLDHLQSLSTGWFEVTDNQMKLLFGNCRQLKQLDIGLDVTASPGTAVVLDLVRQNGTTMTDLAVRQPWFGPNGGEVNFGLELVKACRPGVLQRLDLDGQIFDKQLFALPVINGLREFCLNWCDVIHFNDLSEWLFEGEARELRRLTATARNYLNSEDGPQIDSLFLITNHCEKKGIKVEVGCSYDVCVFFAACLKPLLNPGLISSWRPPLAPISRRVSLGQVSPF